MTRPKPTQTPKQDVRHKPKIQQPVRRPIPLDTGREWNQGSPPGFVKCQPRTLSATTPDANKVVLYAVIGTWFEGDIVEATVKNCFANGCTKVFVVDNNSPDDTQAVARAAGADVARVYETQFYDDAQRLRLMNEVMHEVTVREAHPYLWWLSLDADELPCGPGGQPLLEFVTGLDRRINCVGGNAIDLYPTEGHHYRPGTHPADCMTHGMRRQAVRGVFCHERNHWKHPLLRYENGVFNMAQTRGSHVPYVAAGPGGHQLTTPVEPKEELVIFHAPIRAKEYTFRRLEKLCSKDPALGNQHRSAGDDISTGGNGAVKRWRCLEHVYKGHWDKVELPHSQVYGSNVTGIAVFPWRRLVPEVKTFPRWYPDPNLPEAGAKISLPMAGD